MKSKQYLLVVVLVLIVGVGFLFQGKEKAPQQHTGTGKAIIDVPRPTPAQEKEFAKQGLVKEEDITGVHWGEWKVDAVNSRVPLSQMKPEKKVHHLSEKEELHRQGSLMTHAVKQMIAAGIPPEKITFTGAQSSNDVFGSGRVDIKAFPLLGADCFPGDCDGWKFLPVVKKNKGWYVYGAGTAAPDIIAYVKDINPGMCNPYPPKQMGAIFDLEKPGVYSPKGGATTIKTENRALDGRLEGCLDNHVGDGSSIFIYYRVLLAQ